MAPQRVLVIRLSSIGDIVHALPAVSALGETYPGAEITWAIEDRYALLLENNPFIRRIIRIDTLGWRKRWASGRTLREVIAAVRALREDHFDVVIDFQGLLKTGLISWLCRSRRRVGYARSRHREPGAGLFYTEQVALEEGKHVIEENLLLVQSLGARVGTWQFPLPQRKDDEDYIGARLSEIGAQEFVLVNPGGGWLRKRWPPMNYSALIDGLAQTDAPGIFSIVLTGSPAEENDIRTILHHTSSRRARYIPTTLGQYIALVRRARLFIGGDTGPMHLAAALRVPVVALMGPTDAIRNGPFSSADVTLSNHEPVNHTRRARSQNFLEGIPVSEVIRAVEERLARIHGR
jgi:heptosyltransferase-1